MLNFIRRVALRLAEPENERSERQLRGPLVCKLMTDLNHLEDMTRALAGVRR
jgi:hypothetical protein